MRRSPQSQQRGSPGSQEAPLHDGVMEIFNFPHDMSSGVL